MERTTPGISPGGVLLPAGVAGPITREIIDLKIRTFGTLEVEVKSNWLRIPKERQARYLDEFAISKELLNGFVEDYYSLVLAADLILLAAVVDKAHVQEDYPRNPWYPPAERTRFSFSEWKRIARQGNSGRSMI
jgi:hypothetical protein